MQRALKAISRLGTFLDQTARVGRFNRSASKSLFNVTALASGGWHYLPTVSVPELLGH